MGIAKLCQLDLMLLQTDYVVPVWVHMGSDILTRCTWLNGWEKGAYFPRPDAGSFVAKKAAVRSLDKRHIELILGPPVVPFLTPFLGEGSPTKVDYRKLGTLILTSLLENLEELQKAMRCCLEQKMVRSI